MRMQAALGAAALALAAACTSRPTRSAVLSSGAPAPIGPYSQAVRSGDTLYLAGQIGLDPLGPGLVAGGIQAETRRALANLAAVLHDAGFALSDVVSTTVYMVDLGEFNALNEVYAESFGTAPPARATVGVAALPRGARVEIAAIAVRAR